MGVGAGGHSQVAGDGGVAGHGFWGQVVVAVGAVEEGLAALAVGERPLQDQPRAGLGVQRPPPGGAMLQVEAARGQGTRLAWGRWPGDHCGDTGHRPARPERLHRPAAGNQHSPGHTDLTGAGDTASQGGLSCVTRWDRTLTLKPPPLLSPPHGPCLSQVLKSPKTSISLSSRHRVPWRVTASQPWQGARGHQRTEATKGAKT